MSWSPPDWQVRNLAKFLWRRWNPNGPTWAQTNQASRDEAIEEARAVLVAVGPTIAAAAWDEGSVAPRMVDGSGLPCVDNPYRQEAGR